jgi:glycosyltransferase A (GT-A) superfamily protein (DUF2064 family)
VKQVALSCRGCAQRRVHPVHRAAACRTNGRVTSKSSGNGAARFQRALCLDVLSKVGTLQGRLAPYLAFTGLGFRSHPDFALQIGSFTLLRQRGRNLGERLESAFRLLLRRHVYVEAIGTDSPELTRGAILRSFAKLRSCDAVFGPCPDGGCCLLGLRHRLPDDRVHELFRRIRWALRDSLRNIESLGLDFVPLEPCPDIDTPLDLAQLFERMSMKSASRRAPNTWKFLVDSQLSVALFRRLGIHRCGGHQSKTTGIRTCV